LLIVAAAVHASSLTRDDDEPAPVYMLYDDMGFVPRWVWSLGFYRVSSEATARWGRGSVVVAPLDEHHLRLALHHGRFIFLACHGQEGDIVTAQLRIAPPPLPAPGTEQTPRCVYLTKHEDADRAGRGPCWRSEGLSGLCTTLPATAASKQSNGNGGSRRRT
jgi:hypothetical protein